MAKLVSKTYGDALFDLAVEEHKEQTLYDEVLELIAILKENTEFDTFMNHPKIPLDEKKKVLDNVFEGKLSKELMGFLTIILMKERYREVLSILTYFVERMKLQMNIGTAYITTAIPMKEEDKKMIAERLQKTTTFKTLETHFMVDESLIAGMLIQIGDRVVDSSVRTKLEKLEREMLAVQL